MSSYIKFMFKYLFEPEALPAELLAGEEAQQPVNYSTTSSSSSSFSSSGEELSPAGQSIMGNKSSGRLEAAAASTRRLLTSSPLAGWLSAGQAHSSSGQPAGEGSNSKLWPSKCLGFARMFAMAQNGSSSSSSPSGPLVGSSSNGTTSTTTTTTTTTMLAGQGHSPPLRLGSFSEFEHLIRRQLAVQGPRALRVARAAAGQAREHLAGGPEFYSSMNGQGGTSPWAPTTTSNQIPQQQQQQQHRNPLVQLLHPRQDAGNATSAAPTEQPGQQQVSSLELLECFNQLQLADYYKQYDIFIGLRIASSLSILFIVFILFVIYKTGCRDGSGPGSRSQLRLASSANSKSAKSASAEQRQRRARRQQRHQLRASNSAALFGSAAAAAAAAVASAAEPKSACGSSSLSSCSLKQAQGQADRPDWPDGPDGRRPPPTGRKRPKKYRKEINSGAYPRLGAPPASGPARGERRNNSSQPNRVQGAVDWGEHEHGDADSYHDRASTTDSAGRLGPDCGSGARGCALNVREARTNSANASAHSLTAVEATAAAAATLSNCHGPAAATSKPTGGNLIRLEGGEQWPPSQSCCPSVVVVMPCEPEKSQPNNPAQARAGGN